MANRPALGWCHVANPSNTPCVYESLTAPSPTITVPLYLCLYSLDRGAEQS